MAYFKTQHHHDLFHQFVISKQVNQNLTYLLYYFQDGANSRRGVPRLHSTNPHSKRTYTTRIGTALETITTCTRNHHYAAEILIDLMNASRDQSP
jgi:hypothetical protein